MFKKLPGLKVFFILCLLFYLLCQVAVAHEGVTDKTNPGDQMEKEIVLEKKEVDAQGGLLSIINNAQGFVSQLKKRVAHLKSGGVAVIDENNIAARYLGQSRDTFLNLFPTLFKLVGIRNIALIVIIDLINIGVFIVSSLTLFYLILNVNNASIVLFFVSLLGIVLYRILLLISRSILSPKNDELRFPPLKNATAKYLHRYIALIAGSIIFLSLTCELIRISGASEILYLKLFSMGISLVAIQLVFMVLQKRDEFTTFLSSQFPGSGLLSRLVPYWSYFAVLSVCMLWMGGIVDRVIFGSTGGKGTLSLLVVAVFFLSVWILDLLFNFFFDLLKKYGTPPEKPTLDQESKEDDNKVKLPRNPLGDLKDKTTMEKVLKTALKLVFSILFFTFVLKLWGIDIQFGYTVAMAMFKILIVICIFYVIWEIISSVIERRIILEMPEEEEKDEGGAGGSRIGTLLLLLKKFIFFSMIIMGILVILSSLGINITPLIAGAGVVGLAISFGSQSLVKDIIAGLFFMMDDAFRVGDYITIGSQKGTVEKITLRSLVLRHPRGKLDTIGFGNINSVSNLSRDYTITKLEFRVRYDTDIDKLRKIVKKRVYQPIMQNEELAPKLLSPIKSQGVKHMDDSAMIARIKYKTLPGDQFAIRKEIYQLMQQAFKEEGIEFAHKNVTVYIPDSNEGSRAENIKKNPELVKKAAGAAALSIEQDEQEALKKKMEK